MALSLGVTAVASTTSGTTVPTPARTTTPGSTIVLCGDWNTGDPFVSFTDSKGNTWTQIQTELGASPRTRMYYAENILGGTNHTFTLTITSAGQPSIWMVEIQDAPHSVRQRREQQDHRQCPLVSRRRDDPGDRRGQRFGRDGGERGRPGRAADRLLSHPHP